MAPHVVVVTECERLRVVRYKIQAIEGAFNQMIYELIIYSTQEKDYADYTCQIQNSEGMSNANIRLQRKQRFDTARYTFNERNNSVGTYIFKSYFFQVYSQGC